METNGTAGAPQSGGTRILVVAPVRLYCEGIALGLTARGCAVVGTAQDEAGALRVARESAPEVVLCDLAPLTGLARLPAFGAEAAGPRVIALVRELTVPAAVGLSAAGIAGVLAREASLHDLELAVQAVGRGEFPCSPSIVPVLAAALRHLAREREATRLERLDARITPLTRREHEVLRLVGLGLSNKEIARQLFIEVSTVKNHVHNILEKTGSDGRESAIRLLLA